MILVQAGKPVDETVELLAKYLEVSNQFIRGIFLLFESCSRVISLSTAEMNGIPTQSGRQGKRNDASCLIY